jgi:transposase-like protein
VLSERELGAVVPLTQHRRSKHLNNPLERDHQHLKGRVRSMRRFKNVGAASNFCRGHALIRNLAGGYWPLTAEVAPRLRLATAWSALGAAL